MKIRKEDLEKYIHKHPEATQIEIAVFFGTSVSKINKLISEYKIPYVSKVGKKTKIKEEDVKQYLKDFPNATINEMAMQFNVNISTIKRYLRVSGLEDGKRIYRPPAVLKQEIIDYIKINPRASKAQMAADLKLSLAVLNLELNKFRIQWSEEERRYVNKDNKENEAIETIEPISEKQDDDDSDFFYRKVKSEEVESYKRKHPNATIRQIAAFFGTTEEKMKNFIEKNGIDLEEIGREAYRHREKQQESKGKFVNKVIELLNNNPNATPEEIQQKINKKYGQDFPIRRFLEVRRVELIKKGERKEAEKIKSFLLRGIDNNRVTEELVKLIELDKAENNDQERD